MAALQNLLRRWMRRSLSEVTAVNKERLIAFTDAVLAIIMTILVLELDKPDEPTLSAFWALRQNFFAYFLSFFWLGSLWMALNTLWEAFLLTPAFCYSCNPSKRWGLRAS